jgi:hypothetical protein
MFKMNKIKYLIVIVVSLLLINTSCEDFLEEEPIDAISVGYIYSTPEGLKVGVNALYNLMRIHNVSPEWSDDLKTNAFFMVGTDLGLVRTWFRPYQVSSMTPSSFNGQKWTGSYQIIDRCNAIIVNAQKVEMDAEKRNQILAEAKVIRGELYLDLVRMYQHILLDTTATTPENYQDSVTYESANTADVWELINSDLDFAIEHLDWAVEAGRYGQGAARHIRGKAAMWQRDWTEAVAQFDAIVEDGTHHLLNSPSEVFVGERNHAEALFTYQFDETLGGSSNLAGGAFHILPSFFTSRYYEMNSGEIINDPEYGGQSLGWAFPNDYLQSLYNKENDKRYTSYYMPEKLYVNNPDKENYGEPLPESSYDDNFRHYHFSLKKFFDADKAPYTDNSWVNVLYYRFAETLLLGAEAHWRADNQNPSNEKALEYINLIRTRAGLSEFSSFDLDTYLEESARELAFEKNRWFLLKRMGLLVERQSMYYQYGSTSTNVVNEPMQPYMVNLPVPQSQIDLMGNPDMQADGY